MNGVERIAAERQRQVGVEGWTPEHDDEHDSAELVLAARSYLSRTTDQRPDGERDYRFPPPPTWPWDASWWKPSDDPVRNLIKAGALIAAEIDRLQRHG